MTSRREEIEEEVARCEDEIAAQEFELANFKSAEETIRLVSLMEQNRRRLADLLTEWEHISGMLDKSENALMGVRTNDTGKA
jgi:hypothetical protein